jgi:hypothetical protein
MSSAPRLYDFYERSRPIGLQRLLFARFQNVPIHKGEDCDSARFKRFHIRLGSIVLLDVLLTSTLCGNSSRVNFVLRPKRNPF